MVLLQVNTLLHAVRIKTFALQDSSEATTKCTNQAWGFGVFPESATEFPRNKTSNSQLDFLIQAGNITNKGCHTDWSRLALWVDNFELIDYTKTNAAGFCLISKGLWQ